MSKSKCTKELYSAFLQASSVRYSNFALSEVSPKKLSHDSVSRWLNKKNFRPKDIWLLVKKDLLIKQEESILIVDDTLLSKPYSKKIELVNYQYSGTKHDVIKGISLVNFIWHGLKSSESIPVDYRIYDKKSDGKSKNIHFRDMLSLAKK